MKTLLRTFFFVFLPALAFSSGIYNPGSGSGGGGGGSSSLETLANGVQIDSPTASVNIIGGSGVSVTGQNIGVSTATYTLNLISNSTNYIQNTSSLQSGATFYVSSGTIFGGSLNVIKGTVLVSTTSTPSTNGVLTLNNTATGAGDFYTLINLISGSLSSSGWQFGIHTGFSPVGFIWSANGTVYARLLNALSTNQFVKTGSNQELVSANIASSDLPSDVVYNDNAPSSTFSSSVTVPAPGGLGVTYGVSVGSMTGAGLSTCGDATHALAWSSANNQFSCQNVTGSGGGGGITGTINAASQFSLPYYSLAGSSTVLSGYSFVTVSTQTGTNKGIQISTYAVITTSGPTAALIVTAQGGDYGQNNSANIGGFEVACPKDSQLGECAHFFSHQGTANSTVYGSGVVNVYTDNVNWDNPQLYIEAAGSSPQNGIKVNTNGYAALELIQNDLTVGNTKHNGQFQFSSHNDSLRAERRRSDNSQFDSVWNIVDSTGTGLISFNTDYGLPASTVDIQGSLGIGGSVAELVAAPANGLLVQGKILNQALGASLGVCTDGSKNLTTSGCSFGGGGGSSTLEVGIGSATFTQRISSPTASLEFDQSQFAGNLQGGATAFITIAYSSITVTGSYTTVSTTSIVNANCASACTITIGNPVNNGKVLTVLQSSSGNVTISPASGNINNQSTALIIANGNINSIDVWYDGANWWIK